VYQGVFGNGTAFPSWLALLLGLALAGYLTYALREVGSSPAPITYSILGFPNVGKTVYLTMLFRELATYQTAGFSFAPYGKPTIERVSSDVSTLSRGLWLPKTEPGLVFYYRALTSIGGDVFGVIKRRYVLEIADYAGEHIEEVAPIGEGFLHKGDFFKQVLQSHGVLLSVDSEFLLKASAGGVAAMEQALIAAIHVLAEEKGASERVLLKTPIALVFLKVDVVLDTEPLSKTEVLISSKFKELETARAKGTSGEIKVKEIEKELSNLKEELHQARKLQDAELQQIKQKVSQLVDVCQRRCANFSYFFVSSVGKINSDGTPPKEPKPFGIMDPLLWLLNKYNK
jgi:hypothetical protein